MSKQNFIQLADIILSDLENGIEIEDQYCPIKKLEEIRLELFKDLGFSIALQTHEDPGLAKQIPKTVTTFWGEEIQSFDSIVIRKPQTWYRLDMRHPTNPDVHWVADWKEGEISNEDRQDITNKLIAILKAWRLSADTADTKTDTKKNSGKKIPPHDVNEVIRYVRLQRKEIEAKKRPSGTLKSLIAEHLESDESSKKVAAMARSLQPSRYGWMLDIE